MVDTDQEPTITQSNIPDWHCEDTVNIAAYLAANPHRNVVRIFARKVIFPLRLQGRASISSPPLDLRVDCHQLTYETGMMVDLTAIGCGFVSPMTPVPPGWTSYHPVGSSPAWSGADGFDGGSFQLNCFTSERTVNSPIWITTAGGNGGNGQAGYPGRIGQPGAAGRHWSTGLWGGGNYTVHCANITSSGNQWREWWIDPGQGPGDGGRGENGGDGGNGGKGGNGGAVAIVVSHDFPAPTNGMVTFGLVNSGGSGGKGADGGAAGPAGAPPGPPTELSTAQNNSIIGDPTDWTTEATAQPGGGGDPGKRGTDGARGADSAVSVTRGSPLEVAQAMARDRIPGSLWMRMHQLVSKAVYRFVRDGSIETLRDSVGWLRDMAGPAMLDYGDIVQRIADLESFIAASPAQTDFVATFARHRLRMHKDVLSGGLGMMHGANGIGATSPGGVDQFTRDHPTLAAIVAHRAAADGERPLPPDSGLKSKDYKATLRDALKTTDGKLSLMAAENGKVELSNLMEDDGDSTTSTADEADLAEEATLDDVTMAEADSGPGGVFVAAVTFVITDVLTSVLGFGLNDSDAQREREVAQDWQRFEQEVANFTQQEKKRKAADDANDAQIEKEIAWRTARDGQGRKRQKCEEVIENHGSMFVGVLDSLDQCDDDDGHWVAVLDGVLLPEISDPVALAAYMALQYQSLSYFMSLRVDALTARMLIPGEWHIAMLGNRNSSGNGLIEPIVKFPLPSFSLKGPSLGWLMSAQDEEAYDVQRLFPAPSPLGAALDLYFQLGPVTPKAKPAPSPRSTAVAATAIIQEVVLNVGQGAFNVFRTLTETTMAFDFGCGSPVGAMTDWTGSALQALGSNHTAPPAVVISHWDKDHYYTVFKRPGWFVALQNPFVGPAYGLKGVVIKNLIECFDSWGDDHLFLAGPAGTTVPNYVALHCPHVWIGDLTAIAAANAVPIPNNVDLRHTTLGGDGTLDKNNKMAITAYVNGRGGPMLLPADASYSYVDSNQRANLSRIQATHHGSRRSLLRDGGRGGGTATDNDIPAFAFGVAGGTVIFSYGQNNQYGHNPNSVAAFYLAKGWTVTATTPPATTNLTQLDYKF